MVTEPLPTGLPTHTAYPPPSSIDADAVATSLVNSLNKSVSSNDAQAFANLFTQSGDAFWRDILAFHQDFRTFGPDSIEQAAKASFPSTKARNFTLNTTGAHVESPFPDVTWIRAHLDFENDVGTCSAIARLVYDNGEWKIYTFYTLLEEVHGWPQHVGKNRPYGRHNDKEPYDVRRAREAEFADEDPQVLIRHNGLATAAVLRSFGVTSLVIDKFERIGDNWRKRYASLSLHDPVHTDHMPLMNFPPTWPTFMQAGKLANWLESYADAMEVNVWLKTTVDPTSTKWDEATQQWTFKILRTTPEGVKERVVKVSHVVLATGLGGGKAKMPPPFKGQESWGGSIVHSSKHAGGLDWKGKRALVVGACTSGHDISVDLVNNGVETTMLQRSPTFIMTLENGQVLLDGGLYVEEELEKQPIEVLDRITDSLPKQVGKFFHQRVVKHLAEADMETLDGLKKAGFKTWPGPEGTGWLYLAYAKAGGYYFTVPGGGSDMISQGKIKVKGGEIASFDEGKKITFTDGTTQEFDLVIFATGYTGFPDTVAETLGPEYSKKMGTVWGFDKELEVNGVARPAGLPHAFFQVGNFMMSRWFSRRISLQIIAQREGKWREES